MGPDGKTTGIKDGVGGRHCLRHKYPGIEDGLFPTFSGSMNNESSSDKTQSLHALPRPPFNHIIIVSMPDADKTNKPGGAVVDDDLETSTERDRGRGRGYIVTAS